MPDPSLDPIAAVFAADPLTLTDGDLTTLITELRRRRSVFHAEEAAKALAPKRSRKPETLDPPSSPIKPISEISLDDL